MDPAPRSHARPRRSAADGRAQQERTFGRSTQLLLRSITSLDSHRGGSASRLGQAFAEALRPSARPRATTTMRAEAPVYVPPNVGARPPWHSQGRPEESLPAQEDIMEALSRDSVLEPSSEDSEPAASQDHPPAQLVPGNVSRTKILSSGYGRRTAPGLAVASGLANVTAIYWYTAARNTS